MTTTTGAARGRPRAFDRDEALRQAMTAFWKHGFEATSVAELTTVMGIGAPSLYAAFGDKKQLFGEVVEVYGRTHGAFAMRALAEEKTARDGVARMLREAAGEFTHRDHPRGCLVVSAATNCTPASADVEEQLRRQRNANIAEIQRRIEADVAARVLPAGTDAAMLARFTAATFQGMSQQARDGATRQQLQSVAEAAMRAWPH
ncbi:TetR/AcrR family transcriptional regulator [Phytohabitans houttuyneae]|uniref:TetR family transcriptional regulator n=1 Tax=Phytohabitans houttuyneae TaxID=1076126 RepID=A0A6V8KEL2_9ACTN|nr:TetR/AcrR family transcriptional regulator [Phytohabitans houttuyneae]GFJ83663.1 TetR family transcriptional regulator [Phytohabitans houttuyneae]